MIGRKYERQKLDHLSFSKKSELLAIIGRRRVGKTYLINEHYQGKIVFSFTGTQSAKKDNQLKKFSLKIQERLNLPISPAVPAD